MNHVSEGLIWKAGGIAVAVAVVSGCELPSGIEVPTGAELPSSAMRVEAFRTEEMVVRACGRPSMGPEPLVIVDGRWPGSLTEHVHLSDIGPEDIHDIQVRKGGPATTYLSAVPDLPADLAASRGVIVITTNRVAN